jgi:hypothetical protein
LLQAYIHVELPESISEERLASFRDQLQSFAEARGKFFVYPEVNVEVTFKEGSLKSYLTIAGVIYAAIAGYGSFRSGIDYLYTDIKRLSETLVSESPFITQTRNQQIIRTEARMGMIGNLKNIVNQLRQLESEIGSIEVEKIIARIEEVTRDTERLLRQVNSQQDSAYLIQELAETMSRLPDQCPYPPEKRPERQIAAAYTETLRRVRRRFDSQQSEDSSN